MTSKPGAKPGGSKTRSPVVRPGRVPGTTVQSVALARPASGRGGSRPVGDCHGERAKANHSHHVIEGDHPVMESVLRERRSVDGQASLDQMSASELFHLPGQASPRLVALAFK